MIGVIDLKDGQAVHARGGRRDAYAAVREAAGRSINGSALALAQLYRHAFALREIYVADLDAIATAAPCHAIVGSINSIGTSLMVDAGVTSAAAARTVAEAGAHTIIVGLETLPSLDQLAAICAENSVVFSLDLRGGAPITRGTQAVTSPEVIATRASEAGAEAIIVLDVARVGAGGGPDIEMLRRIRRRVPQMPLLAGGGVRDLDDLRQLAAVGCEGALVATALHDGRLTPADVAAAHAL